MQVRRTAQKFVAVGVASLVSGFLLSGCGPSGNLVGGKNPPTNVNSYVSLSDGLDELSIDFSAKLIGRSVEPGDSDPKVGFMPASLASVPVVYKGLQPNFEQIASLHPDLVIYDSDLLNPTETAKLKQLGTQLFDFNADSVDDYCKQLYEIGSLMHSETLISSYVNRVLEARSESLADALSPEPKVALLMAGKNSNPYIAGTGSFAADLVRSAAAEPVGPADKKWVPISMESLIALNPDVVVFAMPKSEINDKGFAAIQTDPLLKNLPAVAQDRFFGIDSNIVERRGSQVDTAIKTLHKTIDTLATRSKAAGKG